MLIFLLSVLLALTVSFVCSLIEATLLSLTPAQIAEISEKHPAVGRVWQQFKAAIEQPIAVILILNTAAHTIGASVAGAKFDDLYGDQWIWVFACLFTFAMLQFTEILPKTLGVRLNREVAVWSVRPLQVLILAFRPLLYLLRSINRPFELKSKSTHTPTIEEIAALAGLAHVSKEITRQQEQIIKAATHLSQLRVRDVLISVEEVSFLSTSQSLQDALIAAHMDSHTRFPVCEQNDHDRVVGYVNLKELVYFTFRSVRKAAIELLQFPSVRSSVGVAYPIIVVDEFQDCEDELLELVSLLSMASSVLVAADDFQYLSDSTTCPASEWLDTVGADLVPLEGNRRTDDSVLRETAAALREGRKATCSIEVYPPGFSVAKASLYATPLGVQQIRRAQQFPLVNTGEIRIIVAVSCGNRRRMVGVDRPVGTSGGRIA